MRSNRSFFAGLCTLGVTGAVVAAASCGGTGDTGGNPSGSYAPIVDDPE